MKNPYKLRDSPRKSAFIKDFLLKQLLDRRCIPFKWWILTAEAVHKYEYAQGKRIKKATMRMSDSALEELLDLEHREEHTFPLLEGESDDSEEVKATKVEKALQNIKKVVSEDVGLQTIGHFEDG